MAERDEEYEDEVCCEPDGDGDGEGEEDYAENDEGHNYVVRNCY